MKTRNTVKALLVALLLASSATAQFQLSGEIKNKDDVPLEGVTVSLNDETPVAITTEDGYYLFKSLKAGSYTIKVEFFGYDTQTMSFDLKMDKKINFTLQPTYYLQEDIDVKSIRANKKTPTTYTNVDKEEVEKINYGRDLPYLLQTVPSTVVTSVAGGGVGKTGYRIRGVDPTRINVTVDGIPINDAESQNISWDNMPEMASSINSMQIQRGVGASSNGSSAFGSSINISTDQFNKDPYATRDNTLGSFLTFKNSVNAGTGYLRNKFSIDLRLSQILSNGYIDRGHSDLKAYFGQIARRGKNSSLRLIIFGGFKKTHQAWKGAPESRLNNDDQGMLDFAKRHELSQDETENLLNSGRTYNAFTYSNAINDYQQTHYQLHYSHHFNSKWNMKTAVFLTTGKGNYENYKPNEQFSTYGYTPLEVNGDSINQMDLIRQKWRNNFFYGGIFNVNYNNLKGLKLVLGGGLNQYNGSHYTTVTWGQYMQSYQNEKKFFENKGLKSDGNIYLTANYQVGKFSFFIDVQYRHVDYSIKGIHESKGIVEDIDQKVLYDFLNPKAGISFTLNQHHSIYASYAIANREPNRIDLLEQTSANKPSSEKLFDLEVGYRLEYKKGFLNANIYHMNYQNQLVLTGDINDFGAYTRMNVDHSYRLGLELEGGVKIFEKLGFSANFALSQNKIKNFVEYIDHFDLNGSLLPQKVIEHGTTDAAFAPTIIGGLSINYAPILGLRISVMTKYIGKQFLDNTSNDSRSINTFLVSNFDAAYSFTILGLKEVIVGVRVANLFNQMYESSGYTSSYFIGEDRVQDNFYYPQAGINFMGRLLLKF